MSVYKVVKLHKPFDRVIEVPGSKSITNRALLWLVCQVADVSLRERYTATIQYISSAH